MTYSFVMTSEWWRTAAIYQIYPRSFADANGDGMGDLAGITSRLEELQYLGIDAIWLSPFYTSPQRDAGYDVADYCDVDPRFGTLTDFDAMIAEARRDAGEVAHAVTVRIGERPGVDLVDRGGAPPFGSHAENCTSSRYMMETLAVCSRHPMVTNRYQ